MKKITISLMCFLGSIAFMQSQNTFTSDQVTGEASVTVESLLERVEQIGTVSGNVRDHFTSRELRMLNVHFNGVQNLAPRVITQSNSQVITAGDDIACASPTSFRDNNMFRVFDLAGVFGVLDGFEVNAVEFAIGTITTPSGFPITANIYSVTPGSFPGSYPAGLTLQGTAVYTATNADMASMITLPLTATIPAGEAMVMELVLEDDGSDTNFMRFGCNSNGETGPSYIMAADCGATSPTKFSDLSLTQGLVWNVLGDDEIAAPGPTLIFGINNATENLISFSIDDPDGFTVVGPSSAIDFENAGAIDPNNTGDAYVLDNAGRFFKVDLASGVYTSLGTIAAPGGQTWAGAEFDPVSGNLYAISTNVSQSTLSMIDIAGVSRTNIGATGVEGAISLIIDGAGQGYTHDISQDMFFAIDLATGASTLIGDLGFDANYGQGGCYVAGDDGFVYLSAFNLDNFQSEWRRLDLSDGSSTLVGTFNGGDDQVGWSSPQSDVLKVVDSKLEGFAFYPNPANETLSLKSINNIDSVALFNILGQRVLSAQVDATSKDLDLSSLPAGPYIMKVSVNGKIGTFKVMKN